jgi:hypothetical protein
MTEHINCTRCGTAFDVLEPDTVVAYLKSKGWTKISETHTGPTLTWSQWERGPSIVIIPHAVARNYYPSSFLNMCSELSRFEGRPVAVIVDEMKAGEPPTHA